MISPKKLVRFAKDHTSGEKSGKKTGMKLFTAATNAEKININLSKQDDVGQLRTYMIRRYSSKFSLMNGELNEQQINNILTSQLIGRLACCEGKYPYIVPVTFAFDGTYIYGHSFEGKKLDLLRKNPNVCFEVDIANDISNWQSAVIYGQFEELDAEKAEEARIELFNKAMPLSTKSAIHLHEHDEGAGHELSDKTRIKPIMFRIKINEKTGRFERQ